MSDETLTDHFWFLSIQLFFFPLNGADGGLPQVIFFAFSFTVIYLVWRRIFRRKEQWGR